MRAVYCLLSLCVLAGWVTAQQTSYPWQVGKQYSYNVRGRLMTGNTGINNQYSGLQVTYKIILTVVGPNTLNLKPVDFKAVEVNSEQNGNWKETDLKEESQVEIDGKFREYLEEPIEITTRRGVIESIKVNRNLPTWAINLKKAQAHYFNVDSAGANAILNGNLNRKTNAVRPEEENQDSGFFYETMENGFFGECQTYYTVSQNGPFDPPFPFQKNAQPSNSNDSNENQRSGENNSNQSSSSSEEDDESNNGNGNNQNKKNYNYNNPAQFAAYKAYAQDLDSDSAEDSRETQQGELPWPKAFNTFCNQRDQIYEITKAINFTACRSKPVLSYVTSQGLYGRGGDNSIGSMWERSVFTRVLACGKSRQQFTILNVQQQEENNIGLSLNQRTVAGTIQNLTLVRMSKAGPTPSVNNPVTIKDLSYSFDPEEQTRQREGQLEHGFQDDNAEFENDSNENYVNQNQQQQGGNGNGNHGNGNGNNNGNGNSHNNNGNNAHNNNRRNNNNRNGNNNNKHNQNGRQQNQYNNDDDDSQSYEQNRYNNNQNRRQKRSVWDNQNNQQDSNEDSDEEQNDYYNQQQKQQFQQYAGANKNGYLPKPSLKNPPLNPALASPLQTEGMKKRVETLVKEVVQDIHDNKQGMAQTETLSKISIVAKILRYLPYQDIEDLYHKLANKNQNEQDQTSRQTFLDAVAMAGTNPNVKFLLDCIKNKELIGEQASQIIMTLPLSVRTPTENLLKEFFAMVDSSAVQAQPQVKTTALLAFANLLHGACVNSRSRNSRFPVQMYGQFCDESVAQRDYVPYYIQNLNQHMQSYAEEQNQNQDQNKNSNDNKHWITTYLACLGNIGTQENVQVVQNIMDENNDSYIKVRAILALRNLLVSRSNQNTPLDRFQAVDRNGQDQLTDELIENQVMPLLASVAFDKGEHPEVRMAAASLLLYTTAADVTIWQQLAFSTWNARSQEYQSFVYSSLKSLAKLNPASSYNHWIMARKARAALPLAKPMNQGLAQSKNSFYSQFAEHLQTGYTAHGQYFGSQDSIIPSFIHFRNQVNLGNGGNGENPVEATLQGQTIQKLVDFLIEQFDYQDAKSQQAHPGLEKTQQQLGIQDRDQDEEIEGSLNFKLHNEIERLFSINEQTIQQLIKEAAQDTLPKLQNGIQINYQKTIHAQEVAIEMPSSMGAVTYAFRMPVHVSLRGTVKVANENGLKDVQLQYELHPVYGWKTENNLAYKVFFVGKKYQAGLQRHMVFEAPSRGLIRRGPAGQVILAVTPTPLTKGNPSGKIDLATYHQRPYTIIVTDELWPTSHKEGGTMNIQKSSQNSEQQNPQEQHQEQHEFGEKNLGMSFQYSEQSDYRNQQETSSGWVKFWKKFHSTSCFFNVGWLGDQRAKHVERVLTLDVSKSETKTIAIAFAANFQNNANARSLWKDSSSQSSQSSEESASSEASQDSSSQQNDSQQSQEQYKKNGQQQARNGQNGQNQQNNQNNGQDSNSAARDSYEDQSQAGQIAVVAVIGKRQHIRSPLELRGIQKIFTKQSQTTVQYLLQVSHSNGRLYSRVAFGDAANQAAEDLPKSNQAIEFIRNAVADSPNAKSQPDGCAEFEAEYDGPNWADQDEVVLRHRLLSEELTARVKAELQFGESCKKMQSEIKIRGKLERDQQMTEWAKKNSDEAKKCNEDERKGFHVSPICMYVAEQQAAALNKGKFQVTFNNLSKQFQNATYAAEDFFKAFLFPYMSHDNFHEGTGNQKQINVEAYMTPNQEYVNVHITKHQSKLSFQNVKTNKFVKAFFPPTATQTIVENARDYILGDDAKPTCSLQQNQVSTFDNVTYRYNQEAANDCTHVLVQDCSRKHPVAVYVKNVGNQKQVTILLGARTQIDLYPSGSNRHNKGLLAKAKVYVEINNRQPETLPRSVRTEDNLNELIATVEKMDGNGGIQVQAEHLTVATNGEWVVVKASNSLRNRTCGLCGDFNGEKVAEMRSPKDCPLSSGTALYASYAFQNSFDQKEKSQQQCKVNDQYVKIVAQEESQCQPNAAYLQNSPRRFPQNEVSSSNSADKNCKQNLPRAVQNAVYSITNAALKQVVPNTKKRHQYARKAANAAQDAAQDQLQQSNFNGNNQNNNQQQNAQDIAENLSEIIQKVLQQNLRNEQAQAIQHAKAMFRKAVQLAINPICKASQCCEANQKFNHDQSATHIQYAIEDSSESNEDELPYAQSNKPSECKQNVETYLSNAAQKSAYNTLHANNEDMQEGEKQQLCNQVEHSVRKGVREAFRQGRNARNTPENIKKEVEKELEKQFPGYLHQQVTQQIKVALKEISKMHNIPCVRA